MEGLTVVDHPLAGHLLAGLRDAATAPDRFRGLARRLATVLVLEATRSFATREASVTTPLTDAPVHLLASPLVAVPILRAGLGLLDAVTDLWPDVSVGHIGLERDEAVLQPSGYYLKVPALRDRPVLLLDPMLATGGTAVAATRLLKEQGATEVRLVCVVAAPEGVAHLNAEHPDVRIVTAAVDERLDERGFIVPGVGDFGDRLFGTP